MELKLDNSNISVHLGKTSGYRSTYDPSLLVREPRQNNRTHLNITSTLPFVGYDIWNAYEVSCLLDSGVPIAAYAKIIYPCDNPYIVESKSIKLYLNSFNMQKMGKDLNTAFEALKKTIETDLSNLLQTTVSVNVYNASLNTYSIEPRAINLTTFPEYNTLENIVEVSTLTCDVYNETPSLLSYMHSSSLVVQRYHSSLLKSNCRVTSQPDWGDVYIHLISNKIVDPASLLKYIISFRGENHFHEEIVETIYTRLNELFTPVQLLVQGFYVRRGGIDINPIRSSSHSLIDREIIDPRSGCYQTCRQ